MTRRGMTIIEILVVSSIGVVVLTVLIAVLSSQSKMNRAAQSSVTLQNALTIEETLAADIRQLGVLPARGAIAIAPHGLSFYRCVFDAKTIRLRPVKYGCERTRGGNWRLIRTEATPAGLSRTALDGTIAAFEFRRVADPDLGSEYLKVSLAVIDDDVPPPAAPNAYAARVTGHEILCRIPRPSELGHPRLQRTAKPVVERDLLPLD
jgi:type II secretory pathway pseudopilin PulG